MAKITSFVTVEQVPRILFLCWTATEMAKSLGLDLRVPVTLVGDTGVGKTTIVNKFHKDLAIKMKKVKGLELKKYPMILSMVPPEDIGGLPTYDKESGRVLHRMLSCLPFDTEEPSIIFMDELDRAEPATQNAALQALLGGEYHGHKISPNAYPICAMNGTADIYTNTLSQAARTRMCTIFLSRKASGGAKSYDGWAQKVGIPKVCRVFNEQFGNMFKDTLEYEELAVCTPRTLDMCGMVTLAKQHLENTQKNLETADIYPSIITGLIGKEAAANYIGVEQMLIRGMDPMQVLDDPEEAEIVTDPSLVCYLLNATINVVADKFESRKDMVKRIAVYALRYPNDEWKEIWMTGLLSRFPEFAKDSLYAKWASKKQSKKIGIM